jgi:hypothetical protein
MDGRTAKVGFEGHGFAAIFEKAFRETLNPLKNHKAAKSGPSGAQGFQELSKTRDFAGETISFRFRFVRPFRKTGGAPGRPQFVAENGA